MCLNTFSSSFNFLRPESKVFMRQINSKWTIPRPRMLSHISHTVSEKRVFSESKHFAKYLRIPLPFLLVYRDKVSHCMGSTYEEIPHSLVIEWEQFSYLFFFLSSVLYINKLCISLRSIHHALFFVTDTVSISNINTPQMSKDGHKGANLATQTCQVILTDWKR